MARTDGRAMEALLTQVREAKGPSRRLDYEIFAANLPKEAAHLWDPNVGHFYTSSIDAAATLAKQMLPNWKVGTAEPDPTRVGLPLKAWAKVEPFLANDDGWKIGAHEGFATTVPLAILAATLTALIAQEATDA